MSEAPPDRVGSAARNEAGEQHIAGDIHAGPRGSTCSRYGSGNHYDASKFKAHRRRSERIASPAIDFPTRVNATDSAASPPFRATSDPPTTTAAASDITTHSADPAGPQLPAELVDVASLASWSQRTASRLFASTVAASVTDCWITKPPSGGSWTPRVGAKPCDCPALSRTKNRNARDLLVAEIHHYGHCRTRAQSAPRARTRRVRRA